jgi:transposase
MADKFIYIIGVDVSKNTLDMAVYKNDVFLLHRLISNTESSIIEFLNDIKSVSRLIISRSVFCMEYTGIYNNHLLKCLKKVKANIAQEHPLQIKNSLGIVRGKSDKIDSIRIAQYAYRNKSTSRLWMPPRPIIQQMAELSTLRTRLITTLKSLKTPIKEQQTFVSKSIHASNSLLCQRSINSLQLDIIEIDRHIEEVIKNDLRISRLFKIITSVPSVSPVAAVALIVCTNEFIDINTAKKLACYAGIAPFRHESGGIVKKAKISSFGNKRVKALLHTCAMGVILYEPELKAYYQRKTAEGKPKLAVINAVRNKLLHRIFSCVAVDSCFDKTQNVTFGEATSA